jgi:hypothetical protein
MCWKLFGQKLSEYLSHMILYEIRTVLLQTWSLIVTNDDKIFSADQFQQFGDDIKCLRGHLCFQQEAMMYWGKILQFMYMSKYATITEIPILQTTQTKVVNTVMYKSVLASYSIFSRNLKSWVIVAYQALPYLQDATTICHLKHSNSSNSCAVHLLLFLFPANPAQFR